MSASQDMAGIMDALALKLTSSVHKRVTAWPEEVEAPAILIGYPTAIDFDMTMGRGSDRMTFPVFAIAGGVLGKPTRAKLNEYVKGATSIKTLLDGPLTVGANTMSARVVSATPQTVTLGGKPLAALVFEVEVIG